LNTKVTNLSQFEIALVGQHVEIIGKVLHKRRHKTFSLIEFGGFKELLKTLEDSFQIKGKLTPMTIIDVRDYQSVTDTTDIKSVRKKYRDLTESLVLPALMLYSPSLL
jgi:hypothetical protein